MAVLSIQSHVVYGHVGNDAAVFPLQRLGHEVWPVHTVQFSNHTGYGTWRGSAFGAGHVWELIRGIQERGVLGDCQAVLSGYLGSAETGEAVIDAVAQVRKANPRAVYCCDPVMGDDGKGFFVSADIPELFASRIVPLADIVTPNRFELEALAGIPIGSMADARKAVDLLHALGPGVVLVTSFHERAGPRDDGTVAMLVSDGSGQRLINTPRLDFSTAPNGTGDLTAALFLSRWLKTRDCEESLEYAAAAVWAVLERTLKDGGRELALVSAQKLIENPERRFSSIAL